MGKGRNQKYTFGDKTVTAISYNLPLYCLVAYQSLSAYDQ